MNLVRSFIESFGSDIYIDLGTANTLVMDKRRGLVANEPSVVVYHSSVDGRRKVIAVGDEAKRKMGRTSGNLTTCLPLKDGVVAEIDATEAMLKYFLAVAKSVRWPRPRLVISLPYGVSDVEKRAVRDCGTAAGAREVVLIEEPMAAALGSGLPVESSQGSMVIDIGGGTTEVAVISLYGIVHCEAVRVGGYTFDEAIVEHIRRRHNLIIGLQSAEKLKIQLGSALPGDYETQASVRGVDYVPGLPREITVTSHEIFEALSAGLKQIIDAGKRTLENTPPELLSDIIENGIVIAGGGALMRGMATCLSNELGVPVRIADNPLTAIARGGAQTIRDPDLLSRIVLN